MIVAAEIENNADSYAAELVGIRETASALILDSHQSDNRGFSRFLFSYHAESIKAYTTNYMAEGSNPYLHIAKDANLETLYVTHIFPAVQELLQVEGIDLSCIDMVFPPQISSGFITRLSEKLHLPRERFVDVAGRGPDYFSSSVPYALDYAYEKNLIKSGDTGLIIAVGSGIQIGCAIYHF